MSRLLSDRCPSAVVCAALIVAASAACDRGGKGDGSSPAVRDGDPAPQTAIPADQSATVTTRRGAYRLAVEPEPNPVPFQSFFELNVEVEPVDDPESSETTIALEQFRARMPAHEHGLKTDPDVETIRPGDFRVGGIRFHMRGRGEDGRWVLEFVVDGPSGMDTATLDVQCCRPSTD